jgi:hydroxyacylglutathione hydrolase
MEIRLETQLTTSLEIIGLHAFSDNYIWVLRRNGTAVVVDPGDARPVIDYLHSSGDRLGAILITHRHPDHIGGISELIDHINSVNTLPAIAIPVFGPDNEDIPSLTHRLKVGETVKVAGIDAEFHVLDVGGHTRGHIAYYHPKILFSGDALFVLGCGRLFDGTLPQMYQSLLRIAALPRDTQVFCAHEYAHYNLPFALAVEPGNVLLQDRAAMLRQSIAKNQPTVPMLLGDELDTNPFLRCGIDEVIDAAQRHCGRRLITPVETFVALREWRNQI